MAFVAAGQFANGGSDGGKWSKQEEEDDGEGTATGARGEWGEQDDEVVLP